MYTHDSPRPRRIFRAASAVVALLLLLEVPVALAQQPASWSRVKAGRPSSLVVDPDLDPASVRLALNAARTLTPRIPAPQYVVGVDLPHGPGLAVAGPAGSGTWAIHVLRGSGRAAGSLVFDYPAGVIREPDGGRVLWRSRTGDMRRELLEEWRTLGWGEIQEFVQEVCRQARSIPLRPACMKLMEQDYQAGLLCLAIVMVINLLCMTVDHIITPPSPGETGP